MPTKRRRRRKPNAAGMLAELAFASAETIARRTALMASGRCTPAEYRRMVAEKLDAARRSGFAALAPGVTGAGLLAPWHAVARRNSRRLRRR
jgi:hypothetical protein